MIRAARLLSTGLLIPAAFALADEPLVVIDANEPPAPFVAVDEEETLVKPEPVATAPVPEEISREIPSRPMPTRQPSNPPSRVIQGPFLRRIVPSRYAKPFNCGPYRYEPRIGDIRYNLPRQLTLPGNEGERELLYVLPPRDRGYFVLPRW